MYSYSALPVKFQEISSRTWDDMAAGIIVIVENLGLSFLRLVIDTSVFVEIPCVLGDLIWFTGSVWDPIAYFDDCALWEKTPLIILG
jgi:hypothetical protein